MVLSVTNAKVLATNYTTMDPLTYACYLMDDKILKTFITNMDATQINIPTINFPVPPNSFNWSAIVSRYTEQGWLVMRNKERITLIPNS